MSKPTEPQPVSFHEFIDSLPDTPLPPVQTPCQTPAAADGIQVNYCKNPRCQNFAVPVEQGASYQSANKTRIDHGLRCTACGATFLLKSNEAIREERDRLGVYLALAHVEIHCPHETCVNHHTPVTAGKAFYLPHGKTDIGSPRWRCLGCQRTFSVPKRSTHRQRLSHKNDLIFRCLVNRVPLRRICEIVDIGPKALYDKINFIHRQCQTLSAHYESQLPQLPIKRLWLATDRQEFIANWTQREDRRNIAFFATATADNDTGYCFGMHLNYDPDVDLTAATNDAHTRQDGWLPRAYRRYARIWMPNDYAINAIHRKAAARAGSPPGTPKIPAGSLEQSLRNDYDDVADELDSEVSDLPDEDDDQLPDRGAQIHAEYTLYGHFQHLRRLVGHAEKIRFYLDRDSGMRAACLCAFAPEIAGQPAATRRVDAFFVRIAKNLTIPLRQQAIATTRLELARYLAVHKDVTPTQAALALIKQRLNTMPQIGPWNDRWLVHPAPHMGEPEKMVCHLTDSGDDDPDHLAWLYLRASLHAVDTLFMQIRRRVASLERPIHSQANRGRVWNGYAPYNPAQMQKLLDIMRVVRNYVLPHQKIGETRSKSGKEKAIEQTPAMRLGLTKRRMTYAEVLEFQQ